MRKLLAFTVGILFSMFCASYSVQAEESVSFFGTYVNDGGCERATRILEADYLRTGEAFEGRAAVRVAPFGGDCQQDSVSYRVSLERGFKAGAGFDVIVKFGASENAQTSLYALAEDGMIVTRGDGAPLFASYLPAGVAQVVTGIVGVSRDFGFGEVDVGFNIVPVGWANHEAGQTLHTAWDHDFEVPIGGITTGVSLDIGRASFGDAYLTWSRGVAACKIELAWGLNSIGDGAPGMQMIRGSQFVGLGSPRDTRTAIGCGIRWDLN